MSNKLFLERYSKILMLQMAFVVVVIVGATMVRYFAPELFEELKAIYAEYMNTEISLSLVLDGK